jgi:hypothetical protein
MEADSALSLILTGGVYTAGAVGREGISRDTTPAAFDSNGYLRPCALVRQRTLTADNQVVDVTIASATLVLEIYIYEDSGFSSIDSALARLFTLFNQYQFSNSFPVEWIGTINRERDGGSLMGASLARQEWLIADIQGD